MFTKGATAVASLSTGSFILSIKERGIYSFTNGEWKLEYPLSYSIYHFKVIGNYLFGVGEHGTIIRYNQKNDSWAESAFPTSQRLWGITGNDSGLIVTHAGSYLIISENFGKTWTTVQPFQHLQKRPIIRSLAIEENTIYIGTQIHKESGGLWEYNLDANSLIRIKEETVMMISAIYIDKQMICIAKGSCSTFNGCVEVNKKIGKTLSNWTRFAQTINEHAFLDVFISDGKIFACSSKDNYGYSRVYYGDSLKNEIIPFDTIRGHCFRGVYVNEDFMFAGSEESKWIQLKSNNKKKVH
ncbi:hypothetical protein [Niallia sp. NCCP-28]|uniref:hypothetical protein n=1 Tax=Niallia sp. NCCP-28 TaxID=2934712 RepID=UPI00208D0DFD|nr:hypothetical protein [Niallia sp. NCCP-28]GKU84567.1 hypothetical protein NCCP28_39630 [Niallia sp. NCCP-28]